MLIGIYSSARLVSTNDRLRALIRREAFGSRLLTPIGHAEMEREIQKTVAKITGDKDTLEKDTYQPVELDEEELKKYLDIVTREIKKEEKK
jgi:hypothetical protein